ncbi:MAG TPA: spore coat associated protein CotJA [Lachnospiraceae bacterium]|nr:spore coat associated protein CotJA [Lachnospiraceae bacterium]
MSDYRFEEHFDHFPVAMAYVPWQNMDKIYENLDEAFMIGTIFPELNQPFTGRRCVK